MNADDVSPPSRTHPSSTLDHAMAAITPGRTAAVSLSGSVLTGGISPHTRVQVFGGGSVC